MKKITISLEEGRTEVKAPNAAVVDLAAAIHAPGNTGIY